METLCPCVEDTLAEMLVSRFAAQETPKLKEMVYWADLLLLRLEKKCHPC